MTEFTILFYDLRNIPLIHVFDFMTIHIEIVGTDIRVWGVKYEHHAVFLTMMGDAANAGCQIPSRKLSQAAGACQ